MIETPRLLLRPWRDEDRAPFAAMSADPAVMEFLGPILDRASSDAAIDRMVALAAKGEAFYRAVERRSDGKFLGYIGVKPILFDAPFGRGYEIGWRLGRDWWGAGYATEGAMAALAHGFQTLGLETIWSFAAEANLRSQAVMQRIGMHRVAEGDFDHPLLAPGDPLRRHVLYCITRAQFA